MKSEYGYRPPAYRCSICEENIPSEAWDRHQRQHKDRPEEGAMTTGEVAQALQVSRGMVTWLARTGRIQALPRKPGKGIPIWISKAEFERYVNALAKKPEAQARFAATGTLDG